MNNWLLKLRVFIWALIFVSASAFLYLYIVPTGHISYSHDFKGKSAFIRVFRPVGAYDLKEGYFLASKWPISFDLRTSRNFDQLNLTFKMKFIDGQVKPVLAGVLINKNTAYYETKYIIFQDAPDGWVTGRVKLDLRQAYRSKEGNYGIVLRDDSGNLGQVEISSITAELTGKNLITKLKELIF